MKIRGVKCLKCLDTIYSRARHDFRTCTCGNTSIDGGFDYCKVSGHPGKLEMVSLDIDATRQDLYDDWNKKTDKYGIIHEKRKEQGVKNAKNNTFRKRSNGKWVKRGKPGL